MSLPLIGPILSATVALEIGRIGRFPSAEHLTSCAGATPRVHAGGGKVRCGRLRPDVNRYLKWAYAEAGNSVAADHLRHLAEATYHVLSKEEPYRDPALKQS